MPPLARLRAEQVAQGNRMIFFNLIAVVILAISFGIAFGVKAVLGMTDESTVTLIAAAIAILCDMTYRSTSPHGHWFSPGGGGSLMFLPVWLLGVIWLLLGIARVVNGGEPSSQMTWIIIGGVAVVVAVVAIFRESGEDRSATSAEEGADWDCPRCGHKNAGRSKVCRECLS
jgi:hypothetical protein